MGTSVKLENAVHGAVQYPIEQAENLLNYQVKYGLNDWQLNDPQFTFENGIIKRTNQGASKKSKEQSGDSESS